MQNKTAIITARMTPKVKEQLRQRAQDAMGPFAVLRKDMREDTLGAKKSTGRKNC